MELASLEQYVDISLLLQMKLLISSLSETNKQSMGRGYNRWERELLLWVFLFYNSEMLLMYINLARRKNNMG